MLSLRRLYIREFQKPRIKLPEVNHEQLHMNLLGLSMEKFNKDIDIIEEKI
jgi:hypothetical protein